MTNSSMLINMTSDSNAGDSTGSNDGSQSPNSNTTTNSTTPSTALQAIDRTGISTTARADGQGMLMYYQSSNGSVIETFFPNDALSSSSDTYRPSQSTILPISDIATGSPMSAISYTTNSTLYVRTSFHSLPLTPTPSLTPSPAAPTLLRPHRPPHNANPHHQYHDLVVHALASLPASARPISLLRVLGSLRRPFLLHLQRRLRRRTSLLLAKVELGARTVLGPSAARHRRRVDAGPEFSRGGGAERDGVRGHVWEWGRLYECLVQESVHGGGDAYLFDE